MKFRTYLTILLVIFYFLIQGLLNIFHAPLAGVANAQQATDTIEGYTISTLVSHGYIHFYINLAMFGFLALLWIPYFLFSKKSVN